MRRGDRGHSFSFPRVSNCAISDRFVREVRLEGEQGLFDLLSLCYRAAMRRVVIVAVAALVLAAVLSVIAYEPATPPSPKIIKIRRGIDAERFLEIQEKLKGQDVRFVIVEELPRPLIVRPPGNC